MSRFLTLFLATLLLSSRLSAQEKRELVCLTDLEGGIPYIFGATDDPKKQIGFEVDIMDALSKDLGKRIVREHAQFEYLLPTLNRDKDKSDFAMNGLEITADNLQHVRFTRPYYIYRLQLIARQDDDRFTTLRDCKEKDLVVGALSGSAAVKVLKNYEVACKNYDDQEGPFKDLVNRRVDAVLMDVPIAVYYVLPYDQIEHRKRDYAGLKFVGQPFAEGNYGIAVRRDDEAMWKELDEALGRVIASGELKRILTKWDLWTPEQYRLYSSSKDELVPADQLGVGDFILLLLHGAGITVFITIAGMALAVALGLPIATARLYGPLPLRWLAIGYVEFFRGIPVLLLLYFLYFSLPLVAGINLDPLAAAILGFGLNYAAYEAEIYRNGIQAVPIGQWEAAAALGMTPLATFRRIIFPQSIRLIVPPMTNDFIALFKDTSVVSIITVIELSKQYQILTKTYGHYLEIGLATAALYLIMSVPLGYLSRYLEKRWGVK